MGKALRSLRAVFAGGLFVLSLFCVGIGPAYTGENRVEQMMDNLHWLGHASFRFQGSKILYFDPWKLTKAVKEAGIILISHEHFDHFSIDDIKLISSKDTVIITSKSVAKDLEGKGVVCKEIKSLSPGDNIEVSGVKIRAVASYNTNKNFHTKESKKLGFIAAIDGIRIYHAGDTDLIPEMEDYTSDIALLPVSGTYVMTAEEAAQAALRIKPKIAVPMHYGDIVGTDADARKFKDLLKDKIDVILLRKSN